MSGLWKAALPLLLLASGMPAAAAAAAAANEPTPPGVEPPALRVPEGPVLLPLSSTILSARVRDVTTQNKQIEKRRGELAKEILDSAAERDATLLHVSEIQASQQDLRSQFDEITAALYAGGPTLGSLDLSSTKTILTSAHAATMLDRLLDNTTREIRSADNELSTARRAASEADTRYQRAVALNAGIERRKEWVSIAAEWVRTKSAPDGTVPALPDENLPIAALEASLSATVDAPCQTSWWLIAAAADPATVAIDPVQGMQNSAAWICSENITSAEGIGAGVQGTSDPATTMANAERWRGWKFPDRPSTRILVVGDSLGEGMKLAGLSKRLDAIGYGATIDTRVGRPTSEALRVLRANSKKQWAMVVVETGTNDGGNAATYRKAITEALSLYSCPILWIPPHLSRLDQFDRVVEEYAASEPRLKIVDWDPSLRAHPEWIAGDGIHLTMSGYSAMAQLTIDAIGNTQ